jgi:hypothetical protein
MSNNINSINGVSEDLDFAKALGEVQALARFAFTPVVTESEWYVQCLPNVVPHLVRLSREAVASPLKVVDSILALKHTYSGKNDMLRMFLEAAFVHICSCTDLHREGQYPDVSAFKAAYGRDFFDELDDNEAMLKYRNYMYVAVKIREPVGNRDYLHQLITWLSEGSDACYSLGGGAKPAAIRRLDIYRKEGGVPKIPRKERALGAPKDKALQASKAQQPIARKVKAPASKARQPRLTAESAEWLPPIAASPPLEREQSLSGGGIPSDIGGLTEDEYCAFDKYFFDDCKDFTAQSTSGDALGLDMDCVDKMYGDPKSWPALDDWNGQLIFGFVKEGQMQVCSEWG